MISNMEEYLKSTVEKYCKLVKQTTGKAPILRKVYTPFLSEGHKEAPAARPAVEGEAVMCPWCKCSFPEAPVGGSIPGVAPAASQGGSITGVERTSFQEGVVHNERKPQERTEEQRALCGTDGKV